MLFVVPDVSGEELYHHLDRLRPFRGVPAIDTPPVGIRQFARRFEIKDQAQAQCILGLLMRHMNDIAETLQQAPEHYEPLLMENPNDGDPIPIIDEWC